MDDSIAKELAKHGGPFVRVIVLRNYRTPEPEREDDEPEKPAYACPYCESGVLPKEYYPEER